MEPLAPLLLPAREFLSVSMIADFIKSLAAALAAATILTFLPAARAQDAASAPPMKVKVVVVTMFEVGKDTGDTPGEFQFWYEREKLTKRFPLPAAYHDVMANEEEGVVAFVTGEGTAHSASSVMAVGLDPRFDFSKAYWLIDGIAGADPADASLGSAAWAEWVVDGDLAHEIDAREMPKDWEDPFIPLDTWTPYPSRVRTRGAPPWPIISIPPCATGPTN